MPSVFTLILEGKIPGRFVWKDERAVAILTNRPLQPGHTLVIPRAEIDHWVDSSPDLAAHVMQVAQKVGKGIQPAFKPVKVGASLIGLEVPHVHLHLVPINRIADLDFSHQNEAPGADLDAAAVKLRLALRELGFPEAAD